MFYLFVYSVNSEINRRVMKTVLTDVFAQFNGLEKTPWSSVVIEGTILPIMKFQSITYLTTKTGTPYRDYCITVGSLKVGKPSWYSLLTIHVI